MENEIVKQENAVAVYDDSVFNSIAGSTGFKRIQLYGASSNLVKSGKFPMGHFALVDGQDTLDLGQSFDCLVIAWRPKAIRTGDNMEIIHDPKSEAFAKIQAEAGVQDSGCMCGVEFLLWLPDHGFVPYYLNNKSALYEAKPLRALIGKSATIKVIFIEGKKYSWHAPKVTTCSVPLDEDLPSKETIEAEIATFQKPDDKMSEMAAEAEKNDRAR
ncbi:MAG TPA: hypothetical protein PLE74_01105 [Candidatus Cloacimonadota bacterium]|nr:hypothetical protein [Candidatus Cloacimonadota bacterium]